MSEALEKYQDFTYLVKRNFTECINNGYDFYGAAEKLKFELEPMIEDDFDATVLYIELAHLYAEKNLLDPFLYVYDKLIAIYKVNSVVEIPAQLKDLNGTFEQIQLNYKAKKISKYFEETFNDRDIG
ncbi:hypothetical protein NST04_19180 [Paenibacillus sp. FSL H7-0756]|uniref:hypothetical protein n=1 Tax=Paenibacillus sp. FSL H7-0756 TaxID=2954738 RepID=UPI0030F4C3EA